MAGCHNIKKRAQDGKNTESHVPAPVAGSVTFQVDGIAGGGEPSEHKPEGYDERDNFHADHRIGNQVNTQNEVDESSYDIPPPARDTFPVAKSEDDFQNTAYQHRYTENDT
jgi:hypothetical protein